MLVPIWPFLCHQPPVYEGAALNTGPIRQLKMPVCRYEDGVQAVDIIECCTGSEPKGV